MTVRLYIEGIKGDRLVFRGERGGANISIALNRDKASLDIFWLRDESLEDSDNLPDPDILAQGIVDDLEAALEQFREIVSDLGRAGVETKKE